ncbi:MAG TPA: hypothetical protein VFJ85_00480 [Acidimicrobiales bacterium]|nr:hypothetical protein [Acidimicrobiales bacterium]
MRRQSVTDLDDVERFDLTWVPSFYVSPDALPAGLERVLAATKPGGRIAVGRVESPADPLAGAAHRLRILRDGGSLTTNEELVDLLEAAGWGDVRVLVPADGVPLRLVAGRKTT